MAFITRWELSREAVLRLPDQERGFFLGWGLLFNELMMLQTVLVAAMRVKEAKSEAEEHGGHAKEVL